MITGIWGYVFTDLSAYVAFGVALYVLDRRWGTKFYPTWYGLTRWNPKPVVDGRGFIYNRPTKHLLSVATVIAMIETFYGLARFNVNPMVQIITMLVDVPTVLIGFAIGRVVYRLLQGQDKFIERIDTVRQSAEEFSVADLTQKAREAKSGAINTAASLADAAREFVLPKEKPPVEPTQETAQPVSDPPAPQKDEPLRMTPSERLEQFTRRR